VNINRYDYVGVEVCALTISELNTLIEKAIVNDRKKLIAHHNLHSVYLRPSSAKMRDHYALADYAHIDGMSLIVLGRLLGFELDRDHRVTYVDWIWPLLERASAKGWRIFYLGAKRDVITRGIANIKCRFPDLDIDGRHGYFDMRENGSENRRVVELINSFDPDILMVGMGMPRQEEWIADNYERLEANIVLPSGACIDYIAGEAQTPPRWMGRFGLEWLYRLVNEPGRLWKRCFVEPWYALYLFSKDFVRIRVLGRD